MKVNLLPIAEKKKLFFRKKLNLVLNLEIFFLIFLLFLIFNLFFLEKCLEEEKRIKKTEIEKIGESLIFSREEIAKFKELFNLTEKTIYFYRQQKFYSEGLIEILQATPEGISFSVLEILRPKEEYFLVSILGKAKNRESLSLFRDSLEKNKNFFDISFSPKSWVVPQNAEFFLTFKIRWSK